MLYISLVLISILLLVAYVFRYTEGFANNEDKAITIITWFNNNPLSYENYRHDLNKNGRLETDVVDYQLAKNLFDNKQLTKENLLNVLGESMP